jgi:hypothetical protein
MEAVEARVLHDEAVRSAKLLMRIDASSNKRMQLTSGAARMDAARS